MARSEQRTDWLGNEYTAHFDDDGNKVGESREQADWLGNPYTEHRDADGNKTGESREETSWLGTPYVEHTDNDGNKVGESRREADWIGNAYTAHTNTAGDRIGTSRGDTDWLGNEYTRHQGDTPYLAGSKAKTPKNTTRDESTGSGSNSDYSTDCDSDNGGRSASNGSGAWLVSILVVGFLIYQGKQSAPSTAPPNQSNLAETKQLEFPKPRLQPKDDDVVHPLPPPTADTHETTRPPPASQPEEIPSPQPWPRLPPVLPKRHVSAGDTPYVVNVANDDPEQLNVRSGPGQFFDPVGWIPWNGRQLVYEGRTERNGNDLWILVRWGDVVGWVHSDYVKPND